MCLTNESSKVVLSLVVQLALTLVSCLSRNSAVQELLYTFFNFSSVTNNEALLLMLTVKHILYFTMKKNCSTIMIEPKKLSKII